MVRNGTQTIASSEAAFGVRAIDVIIIGQLP